MVYASSGLALLQFFSVGNFLLFVDIKDLFVIENRRDGCVGILIKKVQLKKFSKNKV